MTYRLSRRADQELDLIYESSAERFGIAQADSYVTGLRQTLSFLAEFPNAAREREEMPQPARAYPYKAHLIVYETDGNDIVILRLPHARTDWLNEVD